MTWREVMCHQRDQFSVSLLVGGVLRDSLILPDMKTCHGVLLRDVTILRKVSVFLKSVHFISLLVILLHYVWEIVIHQRGAVWYDITVQDSVMMTLCGVSRTITV